jgi:hypothetical protein
VLMFASKVNAKRRPDGCPSAALRRTEEGRPAATHAPCERCLNWRFNASGPCGPGGYGLPVKYMARRIIFLLLCVGIALIISGARVLSRSADAPVTCNGQSMSQGDRCHDNRVRGTGPGKTYDKMKSEQAPNRPWELVRWSSVQW